ncbi:EamA/RhaT family transporter [Bacillus salipaludis]|uniref:EamA family transporter n=1 Tax=Bacillus salipaludis TaxID=2547811 RepID=A0A4R5VMD3_9BACI|nr:EamA family transporter [Bacillus salipaludis]MDQ6596156.1 EamA family transporter [Bacillus salipaludis]TDK59074.1 EamA/RhaT family transporter [Bacillus salipaludis]
MKGQLKIITAMLIWGSLGIFVKNINLSSSEIALLRGIIGSIFLIFFLVIAKQKPSIQAVKKNLMLLIFSGAAIGFNWILLFQSYRYTTVSNATLSYYFAPVFVMALSPFVLKERLTPAKVGCIITAMIGLFLVVNIGGADSGENYHHVTGILYGLSAAALYASVVLINKFIKNLSGFETTFVQLLVASIVLFPYVFLKDHLNFSGITSNSIVFIIIIGIIHTGIAYFLYFTSIKELKGQRIAVLSYIDPISAVIFAAIFLGEGIGLMQMVGGILILGSTFLSERIEIQIQKIHNSKA